MENLGNTFKAEKKTVSNEEKINNSYQTLLSLIKSKSEKLINSVDSSQSFSIELEDKTTSEELYITPHSWHDFDRPIVHAFFRGETSVGCLSIYEDTESNEQVANLEIKDTPEGELESVATFNLDTGIGVSHQINGLARLDGAINLTTEQIREYLKSRIAD
ncbi:MAG: hypothetical protein WCP03_00190 [Candidatus Saccharibacteria bacterium]